MSRQSRLCSIAFVLIVFAVMPGCSKKPEKQKPVDLPELVPCEITVKRDGTPLSGATVRLQSTPSTPSATTWIIAGTTNESGIAKMQTYGDFIGAPEGEYIVLISKSDVSDTPRDAMSGGFERTKPTVVVDPSFGNPAKTKLKLTVSGKGPVRETFEVTGP